MTLLLDTTVLIDVLRDRPGRRAMLAELTRAGHSLITTAINAAEVYAGMRHGEEQRTQSFLDTLDCFPITTSMGIRAGRLKSDLARRGRTMSLADAVVAAAAMEQEAALVTDNRKDFADAGVRFFPPE